MNINNSSLTPILLDGNTIVPSKIVCVGRNYSQHIAELGNAIPSEPVIFIKPNTAIKDDLMTHPKDAIHYETELAFVIRSGTIHAVGVGLDLTKRDVQNSLKEKGLPWERAKAFDGSVVFSEFIGIGAKGADFELRLFIDGRLQQQGTTQNMLYPPHELLSNIAEFITMLDDDILMTGTPSGVGKIELGQAFCAQVLMNNNVVIEKTWRVTT